MENAAQIPKTVRAKAKEEMGVVRIVEYNGNAMLKACMSIKLDQLAQLAVLREKVITVLIIGRYQYATTDVISEKDIDQWNKLHKGRVEILKIYVAVTIP